MPSPQVVLAVKRKEKKGSKSPQPKRMKASEPEDAPKTPTATQKQTQPKPVQDDLPLGPNEPEIGLERYFTWRGSSPRRRLNMDVQPRLFVFTH